MVNRHFKVPKRDHRSVIERVDWRLHLDRHTEQRPLLNHPLIQHQVVAVQMDWNVKRRPGRLHPGDVIDVCVGQQDMTHTHRLLRCTGNELIHFVTGVDDDGLAGAGAGDDEAVLHERRDGSDFEDHNEAMVLCALDDLLFSVKISTAAKLLGAPVYFERKAEAVIDSVREKQPALVIFDLNSVRMRPLDAIAALKADPVLSQIPTLGFVSHADAATIAAARGAGIDEVMARSTFTERLGEILTRA